MANLIHCRRCMVGHSFSGRTLLLFIYLGRSSETKAMKYFGAVLDTELHISMVSYLNTFLYFHMHEGSGLQTSA